MMHPLFIAVSFLLISCGAANDSKKSSGKRVSGYYTVGDEVQFRVEREGFELNSFLVAAKVQKIRGSYVEIEWRDIYEDTLALVEWENSDNPSLERINFNASRQPRAKYACNYEAEEEIELETEIGHLTCLKRQHRCTYPDEIIETEECLTEKIAITGYAMRTRRFFNLKGEQQRMWKRTVTKNSKN